jgi:hypothetical protein
MTYSTTTRKEQSVIVDFVSTAKGNGITNIWACLPKTHQLVVTNQVGQIRKVKERIWFAKPNLRLRSSLAHRADGEPGRASFSTEIRRVSRPLAEAP